MVTDAELARINELAHKKKTVGLTEEERIEQAHLREKFIEDFRAHPACRFGDREGEVLHGVWRDFAFEDNSLVI